MDNAVNDINYVTFPGLKLTIFGVQHNADLSSPKSIARKNLLSRAVEESNHLIIEGEESLYSHPSLGPNNYEMLAVRRFKGKPIFLEEDVSLLQITDRYDIPPRVCNVELAYHGLIYLSSILGSVDIRNLKKEDWDYLNDAQKSRPIFHSGLDIKRGVEDLQTIAVGVYPSEPFGFPDKLKKYIRNLRDYEVFAPRIKNLAKTLNGKKVSVIGINHASAVIASLSDKELPKPIVWEEFRESLTEKEKEILSKLSY